MHRRTDEASRRNDAVTGILSASGGGYSPVLVAGGLNSLGVIGASPVYPPRSVGPTVPPVNSTGRAGAPTGGSGAAVQVVGLSSAVSVPSIGVQSQGVVGGGIQHQDSSTGYQNNKGEMHASILHAIPTTYSSIPMAPTGPPQGTGISSSIGSVTSTVVMANQNNVSAAVMVAASGVGPGSGQFQRLKVEDALSYLDQVKLRFGKQPQVYNDFLDIMKEFKSQSIDTPGVIARVSQLFRGHPELIVGFNTFLPPGYKIEVSVSIPGQQTTVVHTPQGVHHHITPTLPHAPPPPSSVGIKPSLHIPHQRHVLTPGAAPSHLVPVVTTPHGIHPLPSTQVPLCGPVGAGSLSPLSGTVPVSPVGIPGPCIGGHPQPPQHSTNTAPQHPVREVTPAAAAGQHPLSSAALPQPPAQPVEFNHAINYVNKIKLRFQGQPDIYKQFLEILHTYQKEQRDIKDGGSVRRTLTESEVYEKVAKLFENQEDLLQEFGQFLPDATNSSVTQAAVSEYMDQYRSNFGQNVLNDHSIPTKKSSTPKSGNNLSSYGSSSSKSMQMFGQMKRTHSGSSMSPYQSHHSLQPPVKKPKLSFLKDMSAAEAGKLATLAEYAFFDKVRKALRHEETYHNFLRCITLYNEEIVSRAELTQLVHPFLAKFPDLCKWFKDFVGFRDGMLGGSDLIPAAVAKQERISGDLALEIDYTTCKRLGASYCALPKSCPQIKCSGRTALCREVLNDTWVSFPSWSEDSTFVTSRKTQYEEYIYRCEDERFELDVVLETNLATIRVLEGVQKRLQRMSPEEAARFRLDDCLGGTSSTIHQRAIRRIYGEKAPDIIDGLKKNPVVAVPLVTRRLKAKDDEWREAQKGFNKLWREQNEKYYLKSLDHQGITFKQTDVKTIRSKSLLNDIETLFDERHEQSEESGEVLGGPHMVLPFRDKTILEDAATLIIHHVKRQTAIHKEDKAKMKSIVRHLVPDLLFHTRGEMSDDEKEQEDEMDYEDEDSSRRDNKERECKGNGNKRKPRGGGKGADIEKDGVKKAPEEAVSSEGGLNGDATETEKLEGGDAKGSEELVPKVELKVEEPSEDLGLGVLCLPSDDEYRLFMCNNNWYLFLRLHQMLCSRLLTMYEHAVRIATEEAKEKKERKESTAVALRLKPKNEIAIADYYPAMLDMVKNVLDGNLENTTYEDTLRDMFGIHSYTAFTLDKVVNGAVRQLQHLVCDESPAKCTTMFLSELKKGGSGGPLMSAYKRLPLEQIYQKNAEKHLQDENCFKILTYKRDCRLTIELIDTDVEEMEENVTAGGAPNHEGREGTPTPALGSQVLPGVAPAVTEVERWSDYMEKYFNASEPGQMSPALQAQFLKKPVFLPRNLRSWKKASVSLESCGQVGDKDSSSGGVDVKPLEMGAMDNTQCKFNLSSFKMVFVVNSDSYMYKKRALHRAKQSHKAVSQCMKSHLNSWHDRWLANHATEEARQITSDWLMGIGDNFRPNRTQLQVQEPVDGEVVKAPYAKFNKYKCELLAGVSL